jgi:hypothetical protein
MNTTFDATKTNFSPMKIYASQKNFVEAQHEARSNEQINLIETKNYNSCIEKIKHYYTTMFSLLPNQPH